VISKPIGDDVAMNVPNSLTILRILLIPVFIGLLVYERYEYSLAVLLIAGITDSLDGTIARVANQRTRLGAYLDPLADKLLLTSGFITLSALHLVPLWIAILVVSRDMMLLTGTLLARLTESRVDISPTLLGKGTTLFQLAYLVLVVTLTARHMDLRLLQPLLYLVVGFTVLSGFHYLYRGFTRVSAGEA
jgi:cardiolipin synthase